MTAQEQCDTMIERLAYLVGMELHHRAMGRDTLAASYRVSIRQQLQGLKLLGCDPIECLDAVRAVHMYH